MSCALASSAPAALKKRVALVHAVEIRPARPAHHDASILHDRSFAFRTRHATRRRHTVNLQVFEVLGDIVIHLRAENS